MTLKDQIKVIWCIRDIVLLDSGSIRPRGFLFLLFTNNHPKYQCTGGWNTIKEETWLEDTQPHHGARRRAMEFDRPVDEELGAALGGVEDKDKSHDDGVPELRPEQQIQNEEEIRTPPRREPRGVESHQPKGHRVGMNESVSGPGYMAAQRMNPAGRNRPYSEWSPVETLEGIVSRMQRDLENLQTENRFLRTRRTTGPVPLV